ncbi:poly(A) polymerase [Actibacterium mucosum KCTC 23349]|uniref:Poly(A) polymerase n=1 Tax=Actibacterium mucosum KCTC 23349 TaxID=1454373 RepID=A0A037ZLD9_9RHOB|nr:CCA tRNA nucleotidyltransferase [Actibacterium mucosum]KAJ57271.1 poly(A) polymerase [Actibacterium mucosum KCTC 23349]
MTRIDADWLGDRASQTVCAMLEDAGHVAYFVGGCVRNALLGAPVSDLDISTDARPRRVLELAAAAGIRAVPTGIDHGTVTLVVGHTPFEVTTFRRDVETDGRRAVVAFADNVEDDAHRRDFTMNALYAARDGVVLDPVGQGIADLNARRLRFIDDADLRIREDYLRILRFFRFHAWYADPEAGFDPDGLAACAANSAGIETLSRERIGTEMKKLLAAPDPERAVAAMAQSGVLAQILPGSDARFLPILIHLEDGCAPDPVRRLGALGGTDVAAHLRLSRVEARHLDEIQNASGSPAAMGHTLGKDKARDAILLRAALTEQPLPPNWRTEVERGVATEFPLKPADLMPELQGKALGQALNRAKEAWLAADLKPNRAALLQTLR